MNSLVKIPPMNIKTHQCHHCRHSQPAKPLMNQMTRVETPYTEKYLEAASQTITTTETGALIFRCSMKIIKCAITLQRFRWTQDWTNFSYDTISMRRLVPLYLPKILGMRTLSITWKNQICFESALSKYLFYYVFTKIVLLMLFNISDVELKCDFGVPLPTSVPNFDHYQTSLPIT